MKKIALAFSVTFLFQMANAQVEKGSLFTGGSVTINNSNGENSTSDKTTSFSWNISPQFGKAIQQNKVLGFELLAGGVNNKSTNRLGNVSKNSGNQYGVAIFYRQYFPVYKKWMFYGQGNAGLIFSGSTLSNDGIKLNKINTQGASIGASLGITLQVSKKLWLEAGLSNLASINYNHQQMQNFSTDGSVTTTATNNQFSTNFNLNGGSSLAIGFRWIFPAKS
jgi:hypothetical protein